MVVLLYGSSFWKQVLNFKALVRWGAIERKDLELFTFADSPAEAFQIVKQGLEKYYLDPQRLRGQAGEVRSLGRVVEVLGKENLKAPVSFDPLDWQAPHCPDGVFQAFRCHEYHIG